MCGGLPCPDDNDNPFGYKFSWSPKGVLLAAVRKAEQKLSQQLQGEVAEFAEKQEEMQAKQDEYAQNSEQISVLTNELAAVSDELETVKARMDERGNSMTDTSPLIKIK